MKLQEIVTRMMNAAKNEPDDRKSNLISRVADRLAHANTPYASHWGGNLTKEELDLIKKFVK